MMSWKFKILPAVCFHLVFLNLNLAIAAPVKCDPNLVIGAKFINVQKTIAKGACVGASGLELYSINCSTDAQSCLNSKLKGKKSDIKRVPYSDNPQVGNPKFKVCYSLGGTPFIVNYKFHGKNFSNGLCQFKEMNFFVDTDSLVVWQRATSRL